MPTEQNTDTQQFSQADYIKLLNWVQQAVTQTLNDPNYTSKIEGLLPITARTRSLRAIDFWHNEEYIGFIAVYVNIIICKLDQYARSPTKPIPPTPAIRFNMSDPDIINKITELVKKAAI